MSLLNFLCEHCYEPPGSVYGGRGNPLFVEYQTHSMDDFVFAISQAAGNVSGLREEIQEARSGKIELSTAGRDGGIG